MSVRLSEGYSIQPILIPADIVSDNPTGTSYVCLDKVHWATLAFQFAAITCDSCTVTLEASTAGSSNATEVAIGFNYRLLQAVGIMDADRDAIGTATSTGVAVAASDDNKVLLVEVDPAAVTTLGEDYRYIRGVCTPGDATAMVVGVVAYLEPRFPGNATISST